LALDAQTALKLYLMTVEQLVALLKGITELVGVLVWPAVAIYVLVRFGPGLREFFGSLGELTFKAAGVEATAKRRQVEAAVALGAAVAKSPTADAETSTEAAQRARDVADVVAERVNPRTVREARGSRVLWVDDRPGNNVLERRSLEVIGIEFDLSTSTEDALNRLATTSYDAVVSDMERPPDTRAGYTLLDTMRHRGIKTPFIIYAGSNAPEHKDEAKRHGAMGSTNRADELFALVLSALGLDSARSRRGV
jgi:CheY-like chemotaxis protein